jgi:Protein kinase domain/IPT/TIG domain
MRDDTVTTGQDGYGHEHAGAAGWTVPGYTELKELGSGGAGDVVLARHHASGTLVAIKYLRRKLLADPQWAGLFRTEAQVLAVLDDPNIVRLYEYVESPWGAAIVMELVDGVSVREILAHQGATTAEAALVVLQGSLLGLATAHRRGVVHRDYKPENVLVNRDGQSKLTDFGIAARTGAEPVAAGSLMYAPPEQFAGTPASPAGDVYAATATFYECLTGHPPFVGDTAERLLYQHLTVPVPLDPVPEPLRPLVAAGMAKEPANRPADATTFVTALNAIAARAYGPDWAERGRLALGEAALLLAALWPSAAPAGVQGSAVEQINLSQGSHGAHGVNGAQQSQGARHLWHLRHLQHLRHLRHLESNQSRRGFLRLGTMKAAVATSAAVVVVAAGTALAVGLAGHHGPPPPAMTLPAVTGVSPEGGTDVGGTTVTITGTGLSRATLVTFGGVAGRIISRSDTQITVASPPSTGTVGITVTTAAITADSGTRITGTGTVDVIVTTPTGASKLTAADQYTFGAPPPAVTGVSPDSGGTAGGTTVSITGTGLAGATGVTFGGVPGRITSDSNTQITVTSPPGTGTVNVTVTTPAGTSQTAVVGHYTYAAQPKRPQSISFTAPASAPAGGSATLPASGGGSGNPVVFSVDRASGPGVCTVSGRTVTYAMAGPCVIDANQVGNGTYAAAAQVQRTITVTGQPQSISFAAPASGTAGDSATLSATGGGSGNPVMFSVDPASAAVCTVSGGTVTYNNSGACVIDANQAGNGTYAPAPQVQRTITVASGPKQGQSISFTAPSSGTVGGSAVLSATASSGLPVTLMVDPAGAGVCTLSGRTVTYNNSGSCVIDASQAGNSTYAAAQAEQTITVAGVHKQTQSISFDAPSSGTVGGSAAVSATSSSGLPVTLMVDSGSAGVCALSGSTSPTMVTYTTAGSCVIDASQAGNGTYAAAQAQQTIAVALKPQSITFNKLPSSGTVGGSATVSATASSGLPVTLMIDSGSAGVCALSGSTSGSTVTYATAGSCVIDASQAGNGTYAAAQAKLTIAVASKSQSISFDASSSGTVGGSAGVSAVASSGLPVTLMVDSGSTGVCSLSGSTSGSTVTYNNSGSCVIDASQAGNGTYAAAQAKLTITVNGKPPTVTDVSPSSGACGGGDMVTITGTDLTGATSVSFGSVSVKFTVDSSTQITATSPADPNNAGYVDVTVTTPSGTSAVTEQDQFGYGC